MERLSFFLFLLVVLLKLLVLIVYGALLVFVLSSRIIVLLLIAVLFEYVFEDGLRHATVAFDSVLLLSLETLALALLNLLANIITVVGQLLFISRFHACSGDEWGLAFVLLNASRSCNCCLSLLLLRYH